MSNDSHKKLEEITNADIIEAALAYAKQFEVDATPECCDIIPVRKQLTIAEIGTGITQQMVPLSQWNVLIRPLNTSKNRQRAVVPVRYYSGDVGAMNYLPC